LDRLFLIEKSQKSIVLSTGYPQPVENFFGKTYTMEAKRARITKKKGFIGWNRIY